MEVLHRGSTANLPTALVGQRRCSFSLPSYNASTFASRKHFSVSFQHNSIHVLSLPRQTGKGTRRGGSFLQQEENYMARATSSSVADSIPIPAIDDELEESKFCGQEGTDAVVHDI